VERPFRHRLTSSVPARPRAEIPWLIAIAFWLSGGFIRSGLGARIAYSIVALFGKTTLVRAA
jgi:di/tricarboxylate transporter